MEGALAEGLGENGDEVVVGEVILFRGDKAVTGACVKDGGKVGGDPWTVAGEGGAELGGLVRGTISESVANEL